MNVCTIHLTDVCNLNCSYCSARKHNRKDKSINHLLSIEKYINWIRENLNPSKWFIELTGGGEPTVHPGFIQLIEWLSRKGFYVIVRTNGTNDIPKLKGLHVVTTWHEHLSYKELPLRYDKILIIRNPEDCWIKKEQVCIENNIPYMTKTLINHNTKAQNRAKEIINGNTIFKKGCFIDSIGGIRPCNRRGVGQLHLPNVSNGDKLDMTVGICGTCPFAYDVEANMNKEQLEFCKAFYEREKAKNNEKY